MPSPQTTTRARSLRANLTPAEKKLWQLLRAKQLAGIKFRRQQPVGSYFLDFYCARYKLVVELDGLAHEERAEYDARRDAFLNSQQIRVLRFRNEDLFKSPEGVIQGIATACGVDLEAS